MLPFGSLCHCCSVAPTAPGIPSAPSHGPPSEPSRFIHRTFSNHEFQIEGHNLSDRVLGIQDFAIKWLRPVAERFHSVVPNREGVISSICVAAV
jgi:hypothetical protein